MQLRSCPITLTPENLGKRFEGAWSGYVWRDSSTSEPLRITMDTELTSMSEVLIFNGDGELENDTRPGLRIRQATGDSNPGHTQLLHPG